MPAEKPLWPPVQRNPCINSLVLPIATEHLRALTCVYNQIGRTQLGNYPRWAEQLLARLLVCMYMYLICNPFVQLISLEISQVTSSSTFSTCNSTLKIQDSILKTWYSKLLRIEDQVSRDCQLTFEQYCTFSIFKIGYLTTKRLTWKLV